MQQKQIKNHRTDDPDHPLTTAEFAAGVLVKAQTVRKRYALTGSYFSVKPAKLANGRLSWPCDAVEQLKKVGV